MRWWLCLLLLGLVGGQLGDGCATPPEISRAGYAVLQADLHVHTRLSDGFLSPFEVVLAARRQGLHAIAVTEHNGTFPARLARGFAETMRAFGASAPIVIVGEEVTTRDYHLLAYGLERTVAPRRDLRAVLDEVHRQGAIAVAAHPVERYWASFEPVLAEIDGIEVVHPAAWAGAGRQFSWSDMVAFYQRAADGGQRKTAIGTSDFHFFNLLGLGRTLVFVREASRDGILEALRAGRTVVIGPDGRRFGDPALLAAVDADPLPPIDTRIGYQTHDPLVLASRLAGWLGLVGLLLWRRRETELPAAR